MNTKLLIYNKLLNKKVPCVRSFLQTLIQIREVVHLYRYLNLHYWPTGKKKNNSLVREIITGGLKYIQMCKFE